ncbi:MAG TPA: 4'-phosphopantetheinyl transferase superfamily protein [Rudaea sp.]|jgi:4'-phosphopantetheinyl transferase|uniref:4'-phosphopantetheinyl transferase superfamily protein n=1 Tax=Rudaea sp. TaxID=2136325 RepID=UPI002F926A7F
MRTLAAADFVPREPPAALADGEIHLWFFPQCGITGATGRNAQHCLRELLASYLHIDARDLPIQRDTHGKPFLAGLADGATLQFNLAHSGKALLVGVSRNQVLGVDLETGQRTRPWLALAQRYFAGAEAAALIALPPALQASAFLDLWSCKEAVLKALGRGIAFGLHRLSFALDTDGAVTHLAQIDDEAGTPAQWHVLRLRPESGTCGALAWHGPARSVRAFRQASSGNDALPPVPHP